MTEPILCPYCGAEMRVYIDEQGVFDYNAWTECTNNKCTADGPLVTGYETSEEAEEAARAAALRRYAPMQKPMTLEEVVVFDGEIWMEDKGDFDVWACRCFFNRTEKKMTVHYITMNTEVLEFSTYGKTWRCWERKPTDEERSAAGWE